LVMVDNGGPVHTSTNFGANWSTATNAPSASWASVSSSLDGKHLAAVQWGGSVYNSADAGATWTKNPVPDAFNAVGIWSIASSGDGSKLLTAGAGPFGGPVYLFQPIPALTIAPSKDGILVSWPNTASGFMLQETADLATANWVDVALPSNTNAPTSRLIAPAAGKWFYRLRFPSRPTQ
jgi:hypothetical protein